MSEVRPAKGEIPIAPPVSLFQLLEQRAMGRPNTWALMAPGRSPLTYADLYAHSINVSQTLHSLDLHGNDRVALVLPNGPEAAVAFLTVAASVPCAPLNPGYSAAEYDFYLGVLGAGALLLWAGLDSPARAAARERAIPVIDLQPQREAPAGLFTLSSDSTLLAKHHKFAQPDDVALLLHTSGTTSQPKMVSLSHRNICTAASDTCTALAVGPGDRCLNVLPLHHIFGLVGTLLTSLMAGGGVVCARGLDVTQFFGWMMEFRPTWFAATPTMLQAILPHALSQGGALARCPLRFIRSGSAPLPLRLQVELEQQFDAPVIAVYGMTETSSQITCNPLPPRQRKPRSVGLPAGPEVAIMDDTGALMPAGVVGEIVVRGASVTPGYDNDPMANRQAFRQGWFRTGDAGFLDVDGYLFIVGRFHEIIHRGGVPIAPWAVDEVLQAHPAIAHAVTFAIPDDHLGQDVVAAVVLQPDAVALASDIREFAAARLPDIQVPRWVIIVEAIPLGANGKLQRSGLAEKFGLQTSHSPQTSFPQGDTAAHTPMVELLIGLWKQVMELDHVDIKSHFFELGGDSLLATQVISRVRESMGLELSLQDFLEMPTLAGMARSIDTARRAASALLTPPVRATPRHGPIPLSYPQQRLWLIAQLGLSAHAYHLLRAVGLHGPLCLEVLEQSLQEIGRRHEVLRTTFADVAGQPFQVIRPTIRIPIAMVDLQALTRQEREAQVQALAHEGIRRPFDFNQGPLIRATLLRLAAEDHVLLLTMHHIVSDGWSHEIFWQEFAALYEAFTSGKISPLPELSVQYADFAHWQQQWMQGAVLATLLSYWRQQLAGFSTLQLPTDHPRPAVQTFRGARHFLTISPALTEALKVLSQQSGVTLFMTLLAAFQILLHRYTGQDDIVVGTLIANRTSIEIENLIGFFVNVLVLRTNLSGDPRVREVLERVRQVALGAYGHQDLPYEKILEELRPPRDLSRNPLFQVLFVLHNTPQPDPQLPGLTVYPLEIDPETARFDITLEFWDTPQGLRGRFEYSTDLFEAATIARMDGHFQTLIEAIVANPNQQVSRLPLLTADERRCLLVEWNAAASPYPVDQCLHDVFEAQARRTPDAVAVVCGDESLTYQELTRRANQVAHYLRASGIGPEKLVGLCIERSLAMVIGLLGILKAGAAYLPLDPSYPEERIAFILADARPPVVLTQEHHLGRLPACGPQLVCIDADWPRIAPYRDDDPGSNASPDNVAYLLYTSGTTGNPKGVIGLHCATLNALDWMWRTFPFADDEVCCQKTSINFGDSIQEWLGPLLHGVRIVLIHDAVLKDMPQLVQTLALHHVTRLILVPTLLRTLLDIYTHLSERLPNLRRWFAGGEALSSDLWQRFRECLPHHLLINLYGASEASDDTTWYDTRMAPSVLPAVPIGRPIANTQLYVLDPDLQPVPIGSSGELYVGGAGLTRGYLHHPALTAAGFLPHPFSHQPGARLYRTGDVVRYQPDGNVEYLGRLDHQVKLRGVRIELEEIEAALRQHPTVRDTVVVIRADVHGDPRLIAYIVPAHTPEPTITELRRFLERRLPPALVPAAFVTLETIPLTPSGKADRRALPEPTMLRPALEDLYVAPRTPVEQQLAVLWCHLFGLEQVGIHDNFFELGGHSLLAIRLLARLRDTMGMEVSLLNFFEAPTVAGMAAHMTAVPGPERAAHVSTIEPIPRQGLLPASIAQEHFWFFDQLLPGLPLFNIPCVVRLTGELHIEVMERCLHELIKRHEALRTTLASVDEHLMQRIAPAFPLPLSVWDLRAVPEFERESEARRLLQEESQRPFNLVYSPLLRGCVLRLGEQEHFLLVTLHHIISDGWSLSVLLRELALLYEAFAKNAPSPLAALPIQYADFAYWQRHWCDDPAMESQLAYWQAQLRDPLPMLGLPTDHPRGTDLHQRTTRQFFELPGELVEALKARSQQESCTLFMTCLAAFKILLYGYTGQEDLCVATLVANRTRWETEALIGLLVNTVILRTSLDGNPNCREVLQRVRDTTLAAYANQDVPFEELVRTLEHERRIQRTSLAQVMFIWQNTMVQFPPESMPTLRFEVMEESFVPPHLALTTFDLVLILCEGEQGVRGACIYKTDLFDASTISRMLDDFQSVLTCMSTQMEQALLTFRAMQEGHG